MEPGSSPKEAKMEPKLKKMLTRRAGEPKRRPQWRNMGFQEKFWDPIWDRKINKKSIFGGKVGPTGGGSIEFFCSCCVCGFLSQVFVHFSRKIEEIWGYLCCISLPFSQPGHPHDISYFTMYNALFDFSVSQYFPEKTWNFASEMEYRKSIAKRPLMGFKIDLK